MICVYEIEGVILNIYVDDMVIFGKKESICKLKTKLIKLMEIRDLREISKILSLSAKKTDDEIQLDQSLYIKEDLSDFGLLNCKITVSSLHQNAKDKSPQNEDKFDMYEHRKGIRCLLYIAGGTEYFLCH